MNKRRLLLLFSLVFISLLAVAQIRIEGKHQLFTAENSNIELILFDNIDNQSIHSVSEIHYKASASDAFVQWYVFAGGEKRLLQNVNSLSSTVTYIEPIANRGYIILESGKETLVWVSEKKFVKDDLLPYETPSGEVITHNLKKSNTLDSQQNVIADNYAINDEEDKIACKITTLTTGRDALNENQRPEEGSIVASAPIEIEFFSNPEGEVHNFLWEIYLDGDLLDTQTTENYRFVFEDSGKYLVKLEVSNPNESASDSIHVEAVESQIVAPSVFTPNGDGYNDEFRVAYTSISQFHATIVNRWGRVVYSWTDPQKGWDGTIGGKDAPEGTYFYIITATGSDGRPYKLKGHVNLLR